MIKEESNFEEKNIDAMSFGWLTLVFREFAATD